MDSLVGSGYTYIEAVIEICRTRGVDPEQVGELIRKDAALKAKIEVEAEDLRMLKTRRARLPL